MARMDSLPTVSALMAAYNDEQYVGRAPAGLHPGDAF
jgi:hypothetical protein